VDELHTLESQEALYERMHDEMFEELLDSVALGKRNLIAIHLRSAHGPYAQNYALRPELAVFPTDGLDYRNFQISSYDDAVRYNDFIMDRLVTYFRKNIEGPLYVFLTSDHGQLLGEGESPRYGHGMLMPQVAHVPIMLYEQQGAPEIAGALRRMHDPTHYELARLVIRVLGFEIHDPNTRPGVFYIAGAGFHGLSGYIRVRKPGDASGATEFTEFPAGDAVIAGRN
jgi:glucan phosphoethanolaminetransferase (alkaline phosphatase superfamily)